MLTAMLSLLIESHSKNKYRKDYNNSLNKSLANRCRTEK